MEKKEERRKKAVTRPATPRSRCTPSVLMRAQVRSALKLRHHSSSGIKKEGRGMEKTEERRKRREERGEKKEERRKRREERGEKKEERRKRREE
jgi:hypothetical protein